MSQYVDQPTHGLEILDLVFTSDQNLVSHVDMEAFPTFTDHKILYVKVNYKLGRKPDREEMFLLDSAKRLKLLDFAKAPWPDIRKALKAIDWSPMESLARASPTIAHSWLLTQVLPILERLVPARKKGGGGRNKLHRRRKLIWRKLHKIQNKLHNSTSIRKRTKLN